MYYVTMVIQFYGHIYLSVIALDFLGIDGENTNEQSYAPVKYSTTMFLALYTDIDSNGKYIYVENKWIVCKMFRRQKIFISSEK